MPMIFSDALPDVSALRLAVRQAYRADETATVATLLEQEPLTPLESARVEQRARQLVEQVRAEKKGQGGIDAFMQEYSLSSREGVVLMCLAEALLRIPDRDTADALIRDKLEDAEWEKHLGSSESLLVNASTWGLMLTGRILKLDKSETNGLSSALKRIVARSGEPIIRQAVMQAMRIMGKQFVMGRTIDEALSRAAVQEKRGYRFSYDMLGEAARTAADAARYLESYHNAIAAIGKVAQGRGPVQSPGISIKLSALHPRYELSQQDRVMTELVPRVLELAQAAKAADIGFTIDAEEADRLDLSLDMIAALASDSSLKGWEGFGLAVQAYQKRAPYVIDWLADLARTQGRRLMVRLVKGAYWDSEIKLSQERGLSGYPVYTRKRSTDVSYLVCARKLLNYQAAFFPQFATHNAHTLAAIQEMAGQRRDYEFQRLHGMGEALYDPLIDADGGGVAARIYAPVGSHEDLLAYLVRRLLENGANTSFVNRIVDEDAPVSEIIADPVAKLRYADPKPHPRIPLPADIYGPGRRNAKGVDLSDHLILASLKGALETAADQSWHAAPIVGGSASNAAAARPCHDPADRRRVIGEVADANHDAIDVALKAAVDAAPDWDGMGAEARAACLERAAARLEEAMPTFMALAIREAGKTLPDAVAEIREAVDFCRYYAQQARKDFATPMPLPGPTGEKNSLSLHGRGAFVCVSPWNFPLAIFIGQVTAALAAGNSVIAKPAEQTPLIAAAAVKLLHESGVPSEVLHLLPGDGPGVGAPLIADPRVAGVAFTGSTDTARAIARSLAAKTGPIVPLIAETGGLNAMIADSSALPEQVVRDVIASSFQSAGQRCSALRILCVQDDIADRVIDLLCGAMDELRVGDPGLLSTDVGPVIDVEAKRNLDQYAGQLRERGQLLRATKLPPETAHGYFVAPQAFRIDHFGEVTREIFGPILHVLRWQGDYLDDLLTAINDSGYGLTLGIHSRIDATVRHIHRRLRVGNAYVNRNMIGAVVGVQPFGGEGLSGTGPKAGGPFYLHRFAVERTLTIDTTAAGGNASLLSLEEGPTE